MAAITITLFLVLLGSCSANKKSTEVTRINPLTPDEASHRFLEEVEGEAALKWIRAQNQRSLSILDSDDGYQRNHEIALAIATSKEAIPLGTIRRGHVLTSGKTVSTSVEFGDVPPL